jgi:hypothetical protein
MPCCRHGKVCGQKEVQESSIRPLIGLVTDLSEIMSGFASQRRFNTLEDRMDSIEGNLYKTSGKNWATVSRKPGKSLSFLMSAGANH